MLSKSVLVSKSFLLLMVWSLSLDLKSPSLFSSHFPLCITPSLSLFWWNPFKILNTKENRFSSSHTPHLFSPHYSTPHPSSHPILFPPLWSSFEFILFCSFLYLSLSSFSPILLTLKLFISTLLRSLLFIDTLEVSNILEYSVLLISRVPRGLIASSLHVHLCVLSAHLLSQLIFLQLQLLVFIPHIPF